MYKKKQYLPSNNVRDYIIVIEAISIDGVIIDEMLILSKRVHLKRYYHELQEKTLINLLDIKYLNDELTYKYI